MPLVEGGVCGSGPSSATPARSNRDSPSLARRPPCPAHRQSRAPPQAVSYSCQPKVLKLPALLHVPLAEVAVAVAGVGQVLGEVGKRAAGTSTHSPAAYACNPTCRGWTDTCAVISDARAGEQMALVVVQRPKRTPCGGQRVQVRRQALAARRQRLRVGVIGHQEEDVGRRAQNFSFQSTSRAVQTGIGKPGTQRVSRRDQSQTRVHPHASRHCSIAARMVSQSAGRVAENQIFCG